MAQQRHTPLLWNNLPFETLCVLPGVLRQYIFDSIYPILHEGYGPIFTITKEFQCPVLPLPCRC